jgi:hypothetical protein
VALESDPEHENLFVDDRRAAGRRGIEKKAGTSMITQCIQYLVFRLLVPITNE